MTLRQKLQGLFVTLGVLALLVSAITLWAVRQWSANEVALQEHYQQSLMLQSVRATTFRAFKEAPDAVMGGDPSARQEFEELLKTSEGDFAAWSALAGSVAESAEVREVRTAYDGLVKAARELFDHVDNGRMSEAYVLLEGKLEDKDLALFENISAAAVAADRDFRTALQERTTRARVAVRATIAVAAILTVLLVAFMARYLALDLFRPLREVEAALEALGHGHLSTTLFAKGERPPAQLTGRDELGELVRTFNRMTVELRQHTVSRAFVDNVIDAMEDALVVTDPRGIIQIANPAARELIADADTELKGRTLAEFLPEQTAWEPGDPTACVRKVDCEVRTGTGLRLTIAFTRTAMMMGPCGEVEAYVCVLHEVTEDRRHERELRLSEERYRSLVQLADEIIFTLTPAGCISSINPAFTRLTGWPQEQAIGAELAHFMAPSEAVRAREIIRRVLEGGPSAQTELRLLPPNGAPLVCQFTFIPQVFGKNGKEFASVVGFARIVKT